MELFMHEVILINTNKTYSFKTDKWTMSTIPRFGMTGVAFVYENEKHSAFFPTHAILSIRTKKISD